MQNWMRKWLLLLLSACAYFVPFIASQYLWWTIPLFPLLFFYVALTEELSFKEGFVWGAFVWFGHVHGVLHGVLNMAEGPLYYKIIPLVLIIVYEALCAGAWLWSSQQCINRARIHTLAQRTAFWVASLSLYTLWATECQLFVFDRCEGYVLAQPLLLFAYVPPLLALLPYLGIILMTILFYVHAATIVYYLLTRNRYALTLGYALMLVWLVGFIMPRTTQKPPWLNKIGRLTETYYIDSKPKQVVWSITHDINKLLDKNPDIEIVILPESSIYLNNLTDTPELFNYWSSEYIGRPLHVLVGSFRWTGKKHRNSVFWIYDGKLQTCFDKRHAMILTERMPSLFNFKFISDLYYANFSPISPSDKERCLFTLSDDLVVTPYLCSETYFNRCMDDHHPDAIILSSCNDKWAPSSYIRRLMRVGAQFKAIQWHRDILYVTFQHGVFFDKYGKAWELEA